MILTGIFQTVEFYVILTVVAAAVAAYLAIPSGRGEARLHLLAGTLDHDVADVAADPAIELRVADDGSVTLRRKGLHGVWDDGAVSLAVKVIGFDIEIEERLTPGRGMAPEATGATFRLDFLAPEWYHIRYNSESTGRFCATSLHVRPGIVVCKPLIH